MPEFQITPEKELPTTVYGFAVEFTLGPYPPDAPASHRRAIYTKARPTTPALAAKLRRAGGHTLIIGTAPCTVRDMAEWRALAPDVQERLCLEALRPVARAARRAANA